MADDEEFDEFEEPEQETFYDVSKSMADLDSWPDKKTGNVADAAPSSFHTAYRVLCILYNPGDIRINTLYEQGIENCAVSACS